MRVVTIRTTIEQSCKWARSARGRTYSGRVVAGTITRSTSAAVGARLGRMNNRAPASGALYYAITARTGSAEDHTRSNVC